MTFADGTTGPAAEPAGVPRSAQQLEARTDLSQARFANLPDRNASKVSELIDLKLARGLSRPSAGVSIARRLPLAYMALSRSRTRDGPGLLEQQEDARSREGALSGNRHPVCVRTDIPALV